MVGDANKAKKLLNWEPQYNLNLLIKEMISSDFKALKKQYLIHEFSQNSKIYIAGHNGMVGSAICRKLNSLDIIT